MSEPYKGDYKCPECGRQLTYWLVLGPIRNIAMSCQYGPCKVIETGVGETEEEAYADLELKIEKSGRTLE